VECKALCAVVVFGPGGRSAVVEDRVNFKVELLRQRSALGDVKSRSVLTERHRWFTPSTLALEQASRLGAMVLVIGTGR